MKIRQTIISEMRERADLRSPIREIGQRRRNARIVHGCSLAPELHDSVRLDTATAAGPVGSAARATGAARHEGPCAAATPQPSPNTPARGPGAAPEPSRAPRGAPGAEGMPISGVRWGTLKAGKPYKPIAA